VALGVLTPLGASNIVQPANASCRVAVVTGKRLVYCLVNSLPAGQTATLRFSVGAGAAGSYLFSSYARNVSTGVETGATATLTVG
jgi:predicted hotdog family 3-hydroxylacyl-ACP dehydratase